MKSVLNMQQQDSSNAQPQPQPQQDPSRSPLHMKKESKFFARLLSKEISLATPSFRIYGAAPTSVPFVWESQPGTPKVNADYALSVPPITPPPSYLQARTDSKENVAKKKRKSVAMIRFVASCFRGLACPRHRKYSGTRSSKISYLPL